MVLVRMVPVLVHARKRTFFMTETTISNTICWLFEKVRFCKSFCKLKIHVKKVHGNEWERFFSMNRNYECAKCEKKFFTQAEVRSHERNVHQYFKTKMLPNA